MSYASVSVVLALECHHTETSTVLLRCMREHWWQHRPASGMFTWQCNQIWL